MTPLEVDRTAPKNCRVYQYQLDALDIDYMTEKLPVSIGEWRSSYTFLAFKLTQSEGDALAKKENGSIRLMMNFRNTLTETYKLLCYFEHERSFDIDKDRTVSI